jgi:hypothetical protein
MSLTPEPAAKAMSATEQGASMAGGMGSDLMIAPATARRLNIEPRM